MKVVRSPLLGLVLLAVVVAVVFLVLQKQESVESPKAAVSEAGAKIDVTGATLTSDSSKLEAPTNAAGSLTSSVVMSPGTAASAPELSQDAREKTTSGAALFPVAKLIPRAEDVRAEVAKNPHGTPEALVRLSVSLGDRLDALKSESDASGFLDELDECVTKSSVPTTSDAKTLCLLNAKRVGEKFPALESKFANLEKRAPEKVRQALEFLK